MACGRWRADREVALLHRQLGISPDYAASRGLSLQREAEFSDLVTIAVQGQREVQLVARAAQAWTHMSAAARGAGITLLPISGFRSVVRQAEIIRRKLVEGQSLQTILRINAAPGFSEHHSGRALDIGTSTHSQLMETFEATAAFTWLTAHAGEFGFTMSYPRNNRCGIGYEPWHWCWHERLRKA
ncbi:MAG TPA: M15 family metallopeptidase [Opitutus sp.]|nr:M15 family metallopeptidase [Opitutus sp.]